jgi:hypothetical protein
MSSLVAKHLVGRKKEVKVRYLEKIEDSKKWQDDFSDQEYRFLNHLDGDGVRNLMNDPCPERLLWRHLKYILKHREKMVDAKSAQGLMVFDKKSRIRRLPAKNLEDIERYAEAFRRNEDYEAVLPSKRRKMGSQKSGSQKSGSQSLNISAI